MIVAALTCVAAPGAWAQGDAAVSEAESESESESDAESVSEAEPTESEAEELVVTPAPAAAPPAAAAPAPPPAARVLAPAEQQPADDEGTVLLGSTIGCASGAALPLLGTTLGISIGICAIQEGTMAENPWGGCLIAFFGVLFGVVIGVPSALLYGPCSALGVLIGSSSHALLAGRSAWSAMLGALPGVIIGLIGSGGALAGLAMASDTGENLPLLNGQIPGVGWTIALASLALAVAAAPLGILGAVWLDIANRAPPPAPTTTRTRELRGPAMAF
jgi:hypothetical protein